MCRDCLKEESPDRESICVETGSYLANFSGCANCRRKGELKIDNRLAREEDSEETITYKHICKDCGHVIAEHEYKFSVDDMFQYYEMNCDLCGRGEDTRSILPNDPRHMANHANGLDDFAPPLHN